MKGLPLSIFNMQSNLSKIYSIQVSQLAEIETEIEVDNMYKVEELEEINKTNEIDEMD